MQFHLRKRFAQWALAVVCAALVIPLSACSPQGKTFLVGFLITTPALDSVRLSFENEMKTNFGYVEGQTIRYIRPGDGQNKFAGNTPTDVQPVAQYLIDQKVDLIVVLGTPAVVKLKELLKDPNQAAVFVNIFDPEARYDTRSPKIIDSLSSPGGNMTGSRWGVAETKRLEWFLTLAPNVKHLYAPYNPADGSARGAKNIVSEAAKKLGITFDFRPTSDDADMKLLAQNIPPDADAIYLLPDARAIQQLNVFIQSSLDHKLPMTAPNLPHICAGALVAYGFDFDASGRQAARIADQLLKGADYGVHAKDLPVETTEFFLSINVATANKIGLKLPNSILLQANNLIYDSPARTGVCAPSTPSTPAPASGATPTATVVPPTAAPTATPVTF